MLNMLLGNLLILINLYIFSEKLLKCKVNNKFIVFGSIVFGALILCSRSYPSLQLYGSFLMMGFYFLFVIILYNGKLLSKLVLTIAFIMVASISEVIVANMFNLLFELQASDLNTVLYALALITSSILTFLVLNVITQWIQLQKYAKLPKTTWLIFVLPITTFLFILNISDYFETFRTNAMIAPIIFGLLVANLISIYIFFQTIHSMNLKNEIKSMQIKYDTINSLYQNNFNFLHDTIWKLNDMYKKVQKEEYDHLDKDIEELSELALKKFNIINTNSSIVSSVLNYRLEDITNHDIQVKTDLLYNDYSFLPMQAQNDLFSLLVNLAIDSCIFTSIPNKIVVLKSEKIHTNVVLKCVFTFDQQNMKLDSYIISEIEKMVSANKGIMQISMNSPHNCELLIMFTM